MKNLTIPNGYVVLEVRIPRKGAVETKIIRDGATSCSEGDDKRLIDGVINGPIEGMGGKLGQTVDQGRTDDYWQKIKQPIIQNLPSEENDGGSFFGPKSPEKKLDQGYGV